MGQSAAVGSPAAREVFETADAVLGFSLSKLCFEGPEADLRLTEIQQPAILATSIALLRALEAELSLEPVCVLGHSLGEYTALVAAGALSFEDALRLVHLRGRFMQEAVPEGEGAMAAILGLGASEVEAACADARDAVGGVVTPANYNAPQQTVIAGHAKSVAEASELAKQRGAKRALPLPVSAPFHCDLMAPAAVRLGPELRANGVPGAARPRRPQRGWTPGQRSGEHRRSPRTSGHGAGPFHRLRGCTCRARRHAGSRDRPGARADRPGRAHGTLAISCERRQSTRRQAARGRRPAGGRLRGEP